MRLEFSFTAHAYLDPQLEDVSVVLENALWEGRFWLPYRQEIEIRRRSTWLDIPARGIIRGRWNVDGYILNVGLVSSWFGGDEISRGPQGRTRLVPLARTPRHGHPGSSGAGAGGRPRGRSRRNRPGRG